MALAASGSSSPHDQRARGDGAILCVEPGGLDEAVSQGLQRVGLLDRGDQAVEPHVGQELHGDGLEEAAAVAERQVHGGPGDPGLLGDGVERDLRQRRPQHQLAGGPHDAPAPLLRRLGSVGLHVGPFRH